MNFSSFWWSSFNPHWFKICNSFKKLVNLNKISNEIEHQRHFRLTYCKKWALFHSHSHTIRFIDEKKWCFRRERERERGTYFWNLIKILILSLSLWFKYIQKLDVMNSLLNDLPIHSVPNPIENLSKGRSLITESVSYLKLEERIFLKDYQIVIFFPLLQSLSLSVCGYISYVATYWMYMIKRKSI